MANTDIEKIIADLGKRFAAPLPDYYKRRIIFWYDEEREFEDKLDEIQLSNASIIRMTGRNTFAVKKLLSHDDPYGNYLVYCPISYESLEDNWLLDIQLYSEEFRSDLISLWMDEMQIPSTPPLRKTVKAYRKFFAAKDRRAKVVRQQKRIDKPAQLHLAVMAAITGAKSREPADIVQTLLEAGVAEDNRLYADLETYGAKDAFWTMISQATGYNEADVDLDHLICHILMTASTRTMQSENLLGLERYLSVPHQAWCYDFVSDWLHSDRNDHLRRLARFAESTLRLPERFMQLPLNELLDTECFPCVHECVLHKLMEDIVQNVIDAGTITAAVEKRRTCVWYGEVAPFYEGLSQVANMQQFFTEHAAGFHTVEAQNVWREYVSDYYRMDGFYRQFHLAYAESLKAFHGELNDLFAQVAEKVEGLYVHWFLDQLGENWTRAIEDDLKQCGKIAEVPQQEDFYAKWVRATDGKVVVIISDALRYEVAASLAEQLKRETQSKVELSAMQGIFPTITKFGMAALLPHKQLTVEIKGSGSLSIQADGMSTDSGYRNAVLKAANPRSIALQYQDVVGMNTEQLRALTNGMDVVYIYHDTIDTASHASDSLVFSACDDAITELQNLVRIAANRMNRTHIIITADHGFLYTYSPLREDDKVDKSSFHQMDVEYGRRYAIMRAGARPDFLMPIHFVGESAGLAAFAPRENLRIKMQGGGLNFVHGGVSLQEICVPVISYHHLRNDSKEYQKHKSQYDTMPVTISLLSSSRKISNMIFSLNFYQKEAVGGNRVAQRYQLYFTDEYGKQISDVQTIIADRTSANNQDRVFRVSFNLKQLKFNKQAMYYLVIMDEQGLMLPQREEFRIDIAFAVDEFDFFS